MLDPTRLRQVLLNLVGNALKCTETGEVRTFADCSSAAEQLTLHCSVQDTDPGIPADNQLRIFDRFAQADAGTTRKFGGTGPGLSLSRELVELMGGKRGLESAEGRGSSFAFEIPVARSGVEVPLRADARAAPPSTPA